MAYFLYAFGNELPQTIAYEGANVTVASRYYLQRDKQGQPIVVLDISTDISAYKITHVQLQQATEATQEASRAKSKFLANMSHELRTR